MLKIIFIAIASATAGAYAIHYLNPIDHTPCVIDTVSEEQHSAFARLQTENDQLRALLSLQQSNNTAASATEHKTDLARSDIAPVEKIHINNNDAKIDAIEQTTTANAFSRWMIEANKESKNFDLGTEMRRRFEAEPINQLWAEKQEQEYLSLFIENKELAGFALRDSQCRSNQCALSIGITNIEQANQLVEKVSSALQAQKKYSLIVAAPDPQQGVTKLYIGKDAQSFGFNE